MTGLLHQLPTLLLAVPLLGAAVVVAVSLWLPRVLVDVVAVAVAAGCLVGAGWLSGAVGGGRIVVWFGDWLPVHGKSVGVVFVADRGAAALVLLAAALTLAALTYSWKYLKDIGAAYHALVLVFLAAMSGFVFAGDLFDAFVWFELMGVAAYALTGQRVEEPRSVQAALTFGLVNSLGASCALVGVALLYARTGELNLALVGQSLHGHPADALVSISCALLLSGFLVKAAAVPFHFWTADAEAVAPAPVCALLSGVMVVLGVYGVGRVWWVVFDGVVTEDVMRHTLLVVGALTAILGAVMCVAQRHVKRMLAYSTVSHVGVMLLGVGVLGEEGITAAGLYAFGQAGMKAALFLGTGVLLNRFETVDEHLLWRRGRDMHLTRVVFVVGGLGLAGFPALGTWLGKSMLEHAAEAEHLTWVLPVAIACAALTGGSVLRVALRVFGGLGPAPAGSQHDDAQREEEPETDHPLRRVHRRMLLPAVLLQLATIAVCVVPGIRFAATTAAATFVDRTAYASTVLTPGIHTPAAVGSHPAAWTSSAVGYAVLTTLLACGLACLGVWGARLPAGLRDRGRLARRPVDVLHLVHSGHAGDYVAWLMLGVAVIGSAFWI